MKYNHSIRKDNLGFSLAEVLITLVVVSVGSIGVGKLYTSTITGSSDAKYRFEAATIAEAKVETLRYLQKVGDAPLQTSGTEYVKVKGKSGMGGMGGMGGNNSTPTVTAAESKYQLDWTITDIGAGQSALSAKVKWKNRDGLYTNANSITFTSSTAPVPIVLAQSPQPVFPAIITPSTDDCINLKVAVNYSWTSGAASSGGTLSNGTGSGSGAYGSGGLSSSGTVKASTGCGSGDSTYVSGASS